MYKHWILQEWWRGTRCERCGKTDRTIRARAPKISPCGVFTSLQYPYRCECGHTACMHVRLPSLLCGYILFRSSLLDASRGRLCREIEFTPGPSQLFHLWRREFAAIMSSMPSNPKASRIPISETEVRVFRELLDEVDFQVGSPGWRRFLRMMGINIDLSAADDNGEPPL